MRDQILGADVMSRSELAKRASNMPHRALSFLDNLTLETSLRRRLFNTKRVSTPSRPHPFLWSTYRVLKTRRYLWNLYQPHQSPRILRVARNRSHAGHEASTTGGQGQAQGEGKEDTT